MSIAETPSSQLETSIRQLAMRAHDASHELAMLSTEQKNNVLRAIADRLESEEADLLRANREDLDAAEDNGLKGAMLDRLKLSPERIKKMAEGVRQVAALPDPVGERIEQLTRANGLILDKVRVPIGVIGIIYESRPNVTVDCAVLCLKAGNASILRGGREAFHTNTALARIIDHALAAHDITPDAVRLIPTTDREALNHLLKLDKYINCIIPRGGEGLIQFVVENARMPVIKHYKGVCTVYIDEKANREMAEKIVLNAKCKRPGVCCAAENLFIHEAVAPKLLPYIARALHRQHVELRVDKPGRDILDKFGGIPHKPATEEDFFEEYLDLILAVKVVPDLDAAIKSINYYGSGHSDAIVTDDEYAARRFMQGVDSAAVYWNASTYFTDGYEFGLGAEIGISTDKLHARGPMGLRELTTYKYQITGTGHIRE